MSQALINEYLAELDRIRRVGATNRETSVREAFKDLLKRWGRAEDLVFVAEHRIKTATKTDIVLDGALLHSIRTPLGYWEAKDERDDLDAEIDKKLRKGYPRDNIVFSDDVTAVLLQRGAEVLRAPMDDIARLRQLLQLFFSVERPEIAGFRQADGHWLGVTNNDFDDLLPLIDKQVKAQTKGARDQSYGSTCARNTPCPAVRDGASDPTFHAHYGLWRAKLCLI